jgi:hypothetical protein
MGDNDGLLDIAAMRKREVHARPGLRTEKVTLLPLPSSKSSGLTAILAPPHNPKILCSLCSSVFQRFFGLRLRRAVFQGFSWPYEDSWAAFGFDRAIWFMIRD